MPETVRALIIILALSGFSYWYLAKSHSAFFQHNEFVRIRNAWFLLVIGAFLSPGFWIFVLIVYLIITFYGPKVPTDRIFFYFLLLCAVPNISSEIPGIGGMRYIIDLSYNRLLIILLLVPLLLNPNLRNPHNIRLFVLPSDKYVVSLVILYSLLIFRENTFTNSIRQIVLVLLDILTPYFLISRLIYTREQFNKVFFILLISLLPFALISIFESGKHWKLYSSLKYILDNKPGGYDVRGEVLRASAQFSSPIILGYVMNICFGVLIYLQPLLKMKKLYFYGVASVVTVGLLATVARGPWVGFALLIAAYIWTSRHRVKAIMYGTATTAILVQILALTPYWEKFVQYLPFVGTIRSDTVEYRERLLETSWIVFQKNPLLGSISYRTTPEMETMRQGQGIIDVVNSYIHIVLKNGLVGLTLFLLIFIGLLWGTYQVIKKLPETEEDLIRLGRVLFAILSSILLTIFTVSSIDYVPIFYWAFAGLMAAYIYLAKRTILNTNNNK